MRGSLGGFGISPLISRDVLSSHRLGIHFHIADLFRGFSRCRNDEDVASCD